MIFCCLLVVELEKLLELKEEYVESHSVSNIAPLFGEDSYLEVSNDP